MDRGARCWVTIFCQRINPMLLQEIFQTPFSNNNNNEKKRKIYRSVARQKHTLRKQVVLSRIFKHGAGRLLLSTKKEVSGTFSFTCPVTALPVSYRRRLTLCTALSTSPPGRPGSPATTCICVVGHLPVELNVLFILVLQR